MVVTLREEAARQVFQRYFDRLRALVRAKLNTRVRREEGTEDVVMSALGSFFRTVPGVPDLERVWDLLAAITCHKALKKAVWHSRRKRDYRKKLSGFASAGEGSPLDLWDLEALKLRPTTREADQLIETLEGLPEDERLLASWLIEGDSTGQIAQKLGCSRRTVQRRVADLRDRLRHLLDVKTGHGQQEQV
jgi:RNA polymerase sigma factor (sigma-70 family)